MAPRAAKSKPERWLKRHGAPVATGVCRIFGRLCSSRFEALSLLGRVMSSPGANVQVRWSSRTPYEGVLVHAALSDA